VRQSSQPPASEQHHGSHEACRQWDRYERGNADRENGGGPAGVRLKPEAANKGKSASWQNEAKFLNDYIRGWLEFIDENGGAQGVPSRSQQREKAASRDSAVDLAKRTQISSMIP